MQLGERFPIKLLWKSVGFCSCIEGEQSRNLHPVTQFSSVDVPGTIRDGHPY